MPLSQLPLPQLYQGRILNFAHRGASNDAPENTLAAFTLAANKGYDGIELDVQLTRDDEVFVFHDKTLERTTDKTGKFSDLKSGEISQLDAGSWFDEKFAGEPVPALADVFEAVGKRLLINVEMKGDDPLLAEKTVGLIRDFGLSERVILSSFNNTLLRKARHTDKTIAIGRLLESRASMIRSLDTILKNVALGKPQAFHLHHSSVNAKIIRWAHKQKCRVNVWTVNQKEEITRMRDLGVDMIISDNPDVVHAVLRGEL